MDGARTIGIGSKLDAGSHCTVVNERARVSPFSLTDHDAPWSGVGLARAMSDYETPGRLGTRSRLDEARSSLLMRTTIAFAVIYRSA
jgi:hypothetical protein